MTGVYTFYTTGDYNTSVEIRKINGTYCASDGNSGENNNFMVALNANEGVTYKIIVRVNDLKEDADFDLFVEAPCVHSYEKKITEPTCTSKGYTTYVCSQCGHSFVDDYVEELGHNYTVKTVASTCTNSGHEHGVCTRCGEEYDKEIAQLGHSYEQIIIKPTDKQKGYVIKRCRVCKASYIVEEQEPLRNLVTTSILKLQGKKKALTVTWNKKHKISGYEIQISTTKKFKKSASKKVKASKSKVTFRNLKSKKKYYVRIRTYRVVDGIKVYSKWSKIKSKKVQ